DGHRVVALAGDPDGAAGGVDGDAFGLGADVDGGGDLPGGEVEHGRLGGVLVGGVEPAPVGGEVERLRVRAALVGLEELAALDVHRRDAVRVAVRRRQRALVHAGRRARGAGDRDVEG